MSNQGRSLAGTVGAVAALVTAVAGAVPVFLALRDDNGASSPEPGATASTTPTAGATGRGEEAPLDRLVVPAPIQLDFGRVVPGLSSTTKTVQFENSSDEAVALEEARVTGPGAEAFTIVQSTCDGRELDPEDTCDVDIRFAPPAAGDQAAALVVEGAGGDTLRVPLSGTASLL